MTIKTPFYTSFLWNIVYNTGTKIKVINVENNNPETIVIPNGFQNSLPSPLDNAIGKEPKTVVVAVINIGLNLSLAVSFVASINL